MRKHGPGHFLFSDMAKTKAVFYRLQNSGTKVLIPYQGADDSATQTEITSITAGTGFTSAESSLHGLAVAYAEGVNPVVYDSANPTVIKRVNNTLIWEDEAGAAVAWAHEHIAAPAVASATAVHAAVTLPAADSTTGIHGAYTLTTTYDTVTTATAITNPSGRLPTITGNASGILGGVTITGTDLNDAAVSIILQASGTSTVAATIATMPAGLKTVTSITFPPKTNSSGDTIAVGFTDLVVVTSITNPAVIRALSITGNASGIAGNVKIQGTNCLGVTMVNTIASSGSSTVAGTKAFKTVTGFSVPAKTNSSGDTISIGTSAKLGIGALLPRNTVTKTFFGNVLEGTAPTVVTSATDISLNVLTLNSTLDGSDVDVYYIAG